MVRWLEDHEFFMEVYVRKKAYKDKSFSVYNSGLMEVSLTKIQIHINFSLHCLKYFKNKIE